MAQIPTVPQTPRTGVVLGCTVVYHDDPPVPITPLSVLRFIGWTVAWIAMVLVGFEVQCLIGYLLVFVERLFFGTAVLDGN